MARNLSDLEQRMIAILKEDSRKTVLDLSRELGISRITAKKILTSLVGEGVIRRFTVTLAEDERNLVLVHMKEIKGVPAGLILEYFSLIDGTFIAVMYYENLVKIQNVNIIEVKIATRRTLNEEHDRIEHIHCDYCGKEIEKDPIRLELHRKTYFVCCPNCERDLRRRREFLESHEEHGP